ncbi:MULTISPECIES: hypothetical protein [Pseudomonas]|jgi:hypothetical protein|uniref:Uncharacterized protein n=2 Tax=Pseudomonas TaxID=286 RepID=A0A7X1GHR6_9PSED|nr:MULTISPECIES: hypothetical protein [Pseudomonas]MBC2692614.1 hypothetical protein [Pseudomonas kielensis]MDD1009350.1 hypothetical protein [Pseudomonas shahriarae]
MKPIPILAGTVALLVCVIAGDYLSHDFEPASVEELQAAIAGGSPCVKQKLTDANRMSREISRRDIGSVQVLCVKIDRQSAAFSTAKR